MLLAFAAACWPAFAQPRLETETARLAQHPYWLALLHYAKGSSAITSADFFLSPRGRYDPHAELTATIAALLQPQGADLDEHAQCRFVARYRWLRRHLDWEALEAPRARCPRFEAYAVHGNVESVSVVFATGYLSNPASFFGHILVKFNTRRDAGGSELLDQSVTYGAAVPRGENPVVYVLKGLFGGYDATFSHEQFFRFNHEYAENELRDLWEYALALPQSKVDELVAHSWELLGRKFDYYFLKDNCAFRMAELLQLVLERPLLPRQPWSLPGSVFNGLVETGAGDAPVVREVRRIPSRQNAFHGRYAALAPDEREAALALAENDLDFSAASYTALRERRKIAVVDMLLDYYEYRTVSTRDDAQLPRAKRRLLAERASLPARQMLEDSDPASPARPPHEGNRPLMVRIAALHNSALGSGAAVTVRPAAYDTLALDVGRIPNSTLAMFEVRAVVVESDIKLRSLEFFHVENLRLAATPLPGDGAYAWRTRAAIENSDLSCAGCHVARLEGGVGKAWAPAAGLQVFGMVELHAQTRHADAGWLAASARAGVIATPSAAWKTLISVGRRNDVTGERPSTGLVRWENRFGAWRGGDVRASYERNVASEVQLAISAYW